MRPVALAFSGLYAISQRLCDLDFSMITLSHRYHSLITQPCSTIDHHRTYHGMGSHKGVAGGYYKRASYRVKGHREIGLPVKGRSVKQIQGGSY